MILSRFAFVLLLAFFMASGCIKKTLTDGQIESTRQAAIATDTIEDYELGRIAAQAGLAQFEGMHALAPDNANALYLLTRTWTGYGFAFVEDDLEVAQDAGDDALVDHQRQRARMAYDRAVFYGLQLLGQRAAGFYDVKTGAQPLSNWLGEHFKDRDDAPALYWTGLAWLSRVDVMKTDDEVGEAFVAEAFVGAALIERALDLDPDYEHASPLVVLCGYHAALTELDRAKRCFDAAIARTQGKSLIALFTYASRYACLKGDAALYQDLLNRVLSAQDPDPEQRLTNAIAKRRAKRWLGKKHAKEACGIDSATRTSR